MRRFTILILVVAAFLSGIRADAQSTPSPRLYRGLFGSSRSRGSLDQQLTLSLSLGSGYDWNVLVGDQGVSGQGVAPDQTQSSFEHGAASLNYSLNRSHARLGASAAASASYYPVLDKPVVPTYRGGASGSFDLWTGASLIGSQDISYQPYYQLPWLSGQASAQGGPLGNLVGLNQGLSTLIENHTTVHSGVSVRQSIARRVSTAAGYEYYRTDSASGRRDLQSRGGRADVSVGLTKTLGLHVGYSYFDHYYGAGAIQPRFRNQGFDAGLDFNRALQLTRSLTLGLTTGLTAVAGTTQTTSQNHYFVVGDAVLRQDLGRTWNVALAYNRNVYFDQAFQSPVPSDRISVTFGGMVNRRLQIFNEAGTVQGNIGLQSSATSGFNNSYARTGVAIGLSRTLGLGADYSYFHYRFDTMPALSSGFSGVGNRRVLRIHMDMWVPIFERAGKGNVTQ